MKFLTPDLPFKEDGTFVGLVVCYLCQVHGFNEIASRAIRRKMDQLETADMEQAIDQLSDQRTRKALTEIARGGITALLAEPALYAEVGEKINVDIGALADTIYNDHKPALSYLNRLSAGGMLILAWETTSGVRIKDPAWEFLRHCRNAAAHQGRFNLRNGEPRRPAAWRSKQISAELNGKLLFTDGLAAGFIGPGDVLYLLSDLDRLVSKVV